MTPDPPGYCLFVTSTWASRELRTMDVGMEKNAASVVILKWRGRDPTVFATFKTRATQRIVDELTAMHNSFEIDFVAV